ncbi:MAG: hypothetical protein HY901_16145, partial [Deltaproteobacteria bacterium]|nr:hypothetical protein [Deltaproteobacteria bacterium]
TASSQTAISAEAAYLAFGYGGSDGQGHRSEPWTDPTYFQVRNKFSGNQQVCGKAIGVPAEKWKGNDLGSATNLATAMAQMLDTQGAEKAIGILSTDTSDAHRSTIRTLAFQASGATCSYLPDSTAQSFDKANVRDGRYLMWSPLHVYTTTTSSTPSAQAGAMVTRFAAPKLDQGLLDSIIAGHLIPKCAMKVKRTQEMGPLQPLAPTDFSCGCYFDAKINGLDANQMATRYDCRACLGASDCPAAKPSCNYGYCEAN